ncbi:MAG TPA: hypothetical protein VG308_05720 [Stellaceae bacterium]|jgi:hypothetical protein|nr:hypothetical protein [Stellaceae bacterium]
MAKVNANDRATLERAYPADAFASDAARNERSTEQLMHGVRIGSAPGSAGWFELERAARHAGEPETPHFLSPIRRREELTDQGQVPSQVAAPQPDDGYNRFLDDIVAAAWRFGYRAEQSPGRDEPRLKGFRGG